MTYPSVKQCGCLTLCNCSIINNMTKEETYLKIAGIDNIILNPKDLPEYWKHTAELLKEYSDTQLSEKNKEIERLKAEKWISVKDRLPNENENVLAIESGKLRVMALCYIADDDNEMAWLWGQVYDNLDGDAFVDDDYNVTYWMPLPATIETK